MPEMPTLRSIALAAGLALAGALTVAGPGAWAQALATDDPTDQPAQGAESPEAGGQVGDQDPQAATGEAPAATGATDATPDAAEDAAAPAADAATVGGAPAEPTDATDGAEEAAPDASGNSQDDPNPAADPEGGEVTGAEAQASQAGGELPVIGAPWPAGIDFQPASTKIARDLQWLDGMLTWIIGGIVLFVTLLLAWVIVRFNRRRNPTPASFTHNSPLEVAWTVVPIVILIFIGAFSLPVLFEEQEIPEGDLYIKVTGNQWFWSYEYQDQGIAFDSYMIGYAAPPMTEAEDDPIRQELREAGYDPSLYKLATDTAVVIPVDTTVVMTVTGADVIHSWTIPAFGVKQDAVPGRLAQLWFRAEQEGVFFGQCSELCGKDHAFMPITVRVVSQDAWEAWVAEQGGTLAPAEGQAASTSNG